MLEAVSRVHFVGIGGSGMAPLAQVLIEAGKAVQGSDLRASPTTARLAANGARIFAGHRPEHVDGAELVVISSAVPQDNPELRRARELGLPVLKRAEVWGELMRQQRTIAVAGTHGKTTTSAMIATILSRAGMDPTFLIGGDLLQTGCGAKLGHGDYLVAEADEFDGSFLRFAPWTAVLTNIEADHLDYYHNVEAIVAAFQSFLELLPQGGSAILCWDDDRVRSMHRREGIDWISYGFSAEAQWRADEVVPNGLGGNDFTLHHNGKEIGRFRLRLPGRHNVSNAIAALAVAGRLAIEWDNAGDALAEFAGTRRRFEFRGSVSGILVYDDYAHHPTEVRATLAAARERHRGRLVVVFQPHTFHRTQQLLTEFAASFGLADVVIVCDIYLPPGREMETLGISSRDLVLAMRHPDARYGGSLADVVQALSIELRDGDLLLTMGAGDVYTVAETVLRQCGRATDTKGE